MSILSTTGYIIGGIFMALIIAIPIIFIIWYFKLRKIKKSVIKYLQEVQDKLKGVQTAARNLRDEQARGGAEPITWKEVK